MSAFSHINFLTTTGDQGLYPAGQPVFINAPGGGILVKAGEPVLYDAKSRLSIAPASIATTERVVFAVGVGKVGHPADSLRHLGGEFFNLCQSDSVKATATPAVCGQPQVVDSFFNIQNGGRTHAFEVHLDDSWIRSVSGYNGTAKYPFSAIPGPTDCDNCSSGEVCKEFACKLVDRINGRAQSDPSNVTRFLNRNIGDAYQPFRAALLWNQADSIKNWCLTPADDTCENCVNFPPIAGVTIDETSHTFVGTNDGTNTTVAHFPKLLAQLNAILEQDHGRAHISTPIGKCCDTCIEITSCATAIVFDIVGDTTLEPTSTSNPFTTKTLENACRDCGSTDGTITPTCGIRIYVDPVSVECACDFPASKQPPNYFGRTVTVHAVGDNWANCDDFFTVEAQAQILPEGFGYFYKHKERYQTKGGPGKDFMKGNYTAGSLIPLPQPGSRDLSTTVDCKETYCSYDVVTLHSGRDFHNNQLTYSNQTHNKVLVPQADTTTKTDVEAVLDALMAAGYCAAGTVTCG